MKKNREFFDGADDATVERIAEEFPVLTDEEKDRMFAMSERKFNLTPEAELAADPEAVNGVERYRRPVWRRFATIAAAVAIAVGGVGGGFYLAKGMKNSAPRPVTTSEASTEITTAPAEEETSGLSEDATYSDDEIVSDATAAAEEPTTEVAEATTEEETEKATEPENDPRELEFQKIARNITDRYESVYNAIYGNDIMLSGDNTLNFRDPEGGDVNFFEVIDERYPDMAALRTDYLSIIPESDYMEYLFGGEFTSEEFPVGSALPYEFRYLKFITYDGKLYRNAVVDSDTIKYRDEILVKVTDDNSFYAARDYDSLLDGQVRRDVFSIIRNTRTGGWIVQSVISGGNTEGGYWDYLENNNFNT